MRTVTAAFAMLVASGASAEVYYGRPAWTKPPPASEVDVVAFELSTAIRHAWRPDSNEVKWIARYLNIVQLLAIKDPSATVALRPLLDDPIAVSEKVRVFCESNPDMPMQEATNASVRDLIPAQKEKETPKPERKECFAIEGGRTVDRWGDPCSP
jgi:hypothetical protein